MIDTMGTNGGAVDCGRFEDLLPDYLDGTLPAGVATSAESHRAECAECGALAADLESIRDAAATLPPLEPARDLWAGIESRIAAPVVALDEVRVAAHPAHSAPRVVSWPRRPWLAAAAVLMLVAGTAGVTYTITTSRVGQGPALAAAPGDARPGSGAPAILPSVPATAPATDAMPVQGDMATSSGTSTPPRAGAPDGRAASGAPATLASDPLSGSALGAASVYDREIEIMRVLLDQRRATLDTSTVRVLETNLDIIDRAIRESREALLRDPASQLLNRQLTDALDDKLELMRTAVLVSSGST